MTAESLSPDMSDFVQRFRDLQMKRDTSDSLINDILIYAEQTESQLRQEKLLLERELKDCQFDRDDAIRSRRELQHILVEYQTSATLLRRENDRLQERNPYVVLLIDGDGLLFQEHWIRQGIEGGKKAAYALKAAVASQCGPQKDTVEVVAKVVANLTGLTGAMQRHGCISHPNELKDFTLGFTQAKASFDFIDVGKGKERADSKIKESTRWHLQNHNCKQILLGISHDAGYAPFLDEILGDETTRKRVTILEGFPTVREIVATNVHIMNLAQDLFRSDKLVDRGIMRSISLPQAVPQQPQTYPKPIAPPEQSPTSTFSSPVSKSAYPSPPTSSVVETPPASTMASYAKIIKSATPPPQITIPLSTASRQKKQAKPAQPAWTPGRRGLDQHIVVNQTAMESVKRRKDNNKLCNNHYLRGPCTKEGCLFEHDYSPSAEEIKAIAILTRLNPCSEGQDCDADDCIYGHHCPSVKDGVCVHPFCKFEEWDHPPGTKLKTKSAVLRT